MFAKIKGCLREGFKKNSSNRKYIKQLLFSQNLKKRKTMFCSVLIKQNKTYLVWGGVLGGHVQKL